MKIEIKSRFTKEVLFSFECENNSIKLTLEAAVNAKADLCGADLYDADLRGADLRGEKLTKTPLFLYNLTWPVTITTQHIMIGCQTHKIEEWRNFEDERISEMSSSALEFWTKYKSAIMALADAHSAD